MSEIQQTWTTRADGFTAVLDAVTDWDAASPCAGWTARDVLAHVIDTQREFLAERGHGLGDLTGEEPMARWREHADAVAPLVADDALMGTTFDGFFGPTTIGEALLQFYGFDLLVHRWDIARSQGSDAQFSDAELSVIDAAVDGYGDAAYMPGVFGAPVAVADGASRHQRVLARTGRRA